MVNKNRYMPLVKNAKKSRKNNTAKHNLYQWIFLYMVNKNRSMPLVNNAKKLVRTIQQNLLITNINIRNSWVQRTNLDPER